MLGLLLLAGIASACASIVGLEEPQRREVLTNALDGGSSSDLEASTGDSTAATSSCTAGESDTCPVGTRCLPTGQCAPGCKADSDCAAVSDVAKWCNKARHQCVACLEDAHCADGKKCSPAGTCADRCSVGDAGACSGAEVCCGELCVDPKSDPFNCNGCGNTCTGGSALCCDGQCRDALIDKENCGKCGFSCSTLNADPECTAGSCKWTCVPGYSHCVAGNTGCETATSSIEKCGACDTNCTNAVANAVGVACTTNQCNYASCKSGYVDVDGNRTNGCESACGLVNHPCCPGANPCQGTAYCAADQRCRACRAQNDVCVGGLAGECCGGKVCQSNKRCN